VHEANYLLVAEGLWRDERTQVRCSELELEGELDGARAADLVEGVEAAGSTTRIRKAPSEHLRGLSEQRAAQDVSLKITRVSKIGMIEDIKELGSEL
jgi:hypothetical protein